MAKRKKDPRGRKARSGEPSNINMTIRVTDAERAAYEAAAAAEGFVTTTGKTVVSDWIRAACQDRLAKAKN